MDTDEKKLMQDELDEISNEIWNIKCLMDILYELFVDEGNLKDYHIFTLCGIVCKLTERMSENFQKFKQTHGMD